VEAHIVKIIVLEVDFLFNGSPEVQDDSPIYFDSLTPFLLEVGKLALFVSLLSIGGFLLLLLVSELLIVERLIQWLQSSWASR